MNTFSIYPLIYDAVKNCYTRGEKTSCTKIKKQTSERGIVNYTAQTVDGKTVDVHPTDGRKHFKKFADK